MTFTKAEKKKIAVVLAAQVTQLEAHLNRSGYNNRDGGCPNCGDTGGFYTLLRQLERDFALDLSGI